MVCAFSSWLTSFEKGYPVLVLNANCSKGEPSSQMNVLFSSDEGHGLLEGKDDQ